MVPKRASCTERLFVTAVFVMGQVFYLIGEYQLYPTYSPNHYWWLLVGLLRVKC
jgi:hypothetical protein